MANGRMLKFSFFRNEELAEVSMTARLLFQGLWLLADREGRLEDRVRRIKADIFPYDDVDVEAELHSLVQHGFIQRYAVDGQRYIWVINFLKHQTIHPHEAASTLPCPPECKDMSLHVKTSNGHVSTSPEMSGLVKVKVNSKIKLKESSSSSSVSARTPRVMTRQDNGSRATARPPTTTTLSKNLSYAEQARWVADVPDDLAASWSVTDRREALEKWIAKSKENGWKLTETNYHAWLRNEKNHIPENATEVEKWERILASFNKETGKCSNGQSWNRVEEELRSAKRREREAQLVYVESSDPDAPHG